MPFLDGMVFLRIAPVCRYLFYRCDNGSCTCFDQCSSHHITYTFLHILILLCDLSDHITRSLDDRALVKRPDHSLLFQSVQPIQNFLILLL